MASLTRPRNGRMIAGVCAAIGQRFGIGVGLVRILAVASIILPGPQVLIYAICWIVIPSGEETRPAPVQQAGHPAS